MNQLKSIHDLSSGQPVRSTFYSLRGTVAHVDSRSVKVQWHDGSTSVFDKRDGFVGFVITEKPHA